MPKDKDTAQQTPEADARSTTSQDVTPAESEPAWAIVGCLIVLLAAFSSSASQLNLSPVYGSIPSSRYHYRGITITALSALAGKTYLQKWLNRGTRVWLPVLAFWTPVIQYYSFFYSTRLGPIYGPLVTEALTYYPLLFIAMSGAMTIFENFDMSELSSTFADSIPAVLCYIVFSAGKQVVNKYLPPLIGSSYSTTRIGLQTSLACMYTVVAPSKLVLLALPAVLHTAWVNPHTASDAATIMLNSTLQHHQYSLIDRKESLTGYISVVESQENGFRLMRCDHSLLGGDWLVTEKALKKGQTRKETVYSVFTMLEAVRLVERADARPDKDSSALFM